MTNIDDLKIALVHDWLVNMRGGEKVFEIFCEIFPRADRFTLIHSPGNVSQTIEEGKILTSFIDRLPFKDKYYRSYLPLFPTAIELFDFKKYDIILSSSHCVAKGVRTPPKTLHISYIHTPMRYVWDMYEEYFGPDKIGRLSKKIIPVIANYLRQWDVTSSNRVDYFIANSKHVANRIWRYYRRESTVIHPPVNTDLFTLSEENQDFYLIVSAMVPYKKIDLAIEAFNNSGKSLKIIGNGPEKSKLQKSAKHNIEFIDWQSDKELINYYSKCRALVFPGEEDFGLVPIEAQCCGKPVIALKKGGALETVIGFDGKNEGNCTGIFFSEQNVDNLQKAIEQSENLRWNTKYIHQHAQKFGKEHFLIEIENFIKSKILDIAYFD